MKDSSIEHPLGPSAAIGSATLLSRMWKFRVAYAWMAPAVALVTFATLYPLVFSLDYSLWKTQIFSRVRFVWFANYVTLFRDSRFWVDVYNSVFFTFIGVVISIILGLALAIMLRRQTRLNGVYRTIILVPWVTNQVVLGLMWLWLLNPQLSPIYYLGKLMGIHFPDLFGSPGIALWTVTIINAWRSLGFSLVMMLAALSGIPYEVEEAAEMDGCNGYQKLLSVILPIIRPTAQVVIIVLTISFFNIITIVLVMTGGGPEYATEILSIRLYKEGFLFFNISTASTLTTIMLVVNLALAWVYRRLIRAEGSYS